ncbi:hypothetical protein HYY73_01305 [Candidatus Woesearchaeota archaeon]|nr:hypothetical protein [Candidatus Woesearchaeota archaeon]
MGILDFLKPKKGKMPDISMPADQNMQGFPQLPNEQELYSELPNLPEAPEASGLPEIELPQLKGLGEFDFPKEIDEDMTKKKGEMLKEEESLFPNWPQTPKRAEIKLPERPKLPSAETEEPMEKETSWKRTPAEVPLAIPFMPEQKTGIGGKLITHNNEFFLKAEDFRMARNNLDIISKTQKKHHRLTEIRKEETVQYDNINSSVEEMQRKLMHIDKTLFE